MSVVTSLRATRGGRVAVHLDGSYACTVSSSLLAAFRLYQGRELTEEEARGLRAQAESERVMADAYRLLGHRSRAKAELRRRLLAKGHGEHAVDDALGRLADEGLLDDAAFARAFAADRLRLAGWGAARVVRELGALGVSSQLAEAALGAVGGQSERERAAAALAKSRPAPPLDAAKRRAYQLLLRRGFEPDIAYEAVREWAAGADAESDSAAEA